MSGLSDYLNSLNRDGWSLRRISKEAEKHGHKIDHTTVRKYLNGTHGSASPEALEALAAVFRVDVNDLRARIGRPGVGEPFDLGPEAAGLTEPQREAVRHVVHQFVVANSAIGKAVPVAGDAQRDGTITPLHPGRETKRKWWEDEDLAADSGVRELDAEDADAARRGEESQDPEDWR